MCQTYSTTKTYKLRQHPYTSASHSSLVSFIFSLKNRVQNSNRGLMRHKCCWLNSKLNKFGCQRVADKYPACTTTNIIYGVVSSGDPRPYLSLLKKDKKALILCLKASPLLRVVAERYLYEHITLQAIDKPSEQILKSFLSFHPRAPSYVKSIAVLFSDSTTSIETLQRNVATKRLTEAHHYVDLPRLPML